MRARFFFSLVFAIGLSVLLPSAWAEPITGDITIGFDQPQSGPDYRESGFTFLQSDFFVPGYNPPLPIFDGELWIADNSGGLDFMNCPGQEFEIVSLTVRKVVDASDPGYLEISGLGTLTVSGVAPETVSVDRSGTSFYFDAPSYSTQVAIDNIVVRLLGPAPANPIAGGPDPVDPPVPAVPEPSSLAYFGLAALVVAASLLRRNPRG